MIIFEHRKERRREEKMTSLREFVCDDLFSFNCINLDPLTETYNISFYLKYLAKSPEYFSIAVDRNDKPMGYIMGKAEVPFLLGFSSLSSSSFLLFLLPLSSCFFFFLFPLPFSSSSEAGSDSLSHSLHFSLSHSLSLSLTLSHSLSLSFTPIQGGRRRVAWPRHRSDSRAQGKAIGTGHEADGIVGRRL
jgi:hypothetical protein